MSFLLQHLMLLTQFVILLDVVRKKWLSHGRNSFYFLAPLYVKKQSKCLFLFQMHKNNWVKATLQAMVHQHLISGTSLDLSILSPSNCTHLYCCIPSSEYKYTSLLNLNDGYYANNRDNLAIKYLGTSLKGTMTGKHLRNLQELQQCRRDADFGNQYWFLLLGHLFSLSVLQLAISAASHPSVVLAQFFILH